MIEEIIKKSKSWHIILILNSFTWMYRFCGVEMSTIFNIYGYFCFFAEFEQTSNKSYNIYYYKLWR